MSGGSRKMKTRKKHVEDEADEVEKLLRATEDDVLLKLSIDSHMSRGSSSQILDPDLDRRFQALRSNSKQPIPKSKSNQNPPSITTGTTLDRSDQKASRVVVDDDDNDLFARFAALKSSLPSYSSSASNNNLILPKSEEVDEEEGDEVDKVIRWAMDAARLDPSPSSDVDADDDDISDSSDDESDDDDDVDDQVGNGKNKKGKRK